MKRLIAAITIACTLPFFAFSQAYDTSGKSFDELGPEKRTEMSVRAIHSLKNGVLIVRLRTGGSQVEALNRLLANESLGPDAREAYLERREKVIGENLANNRAIREAFLEKYDFSGILFMPDTAVSRLLDGEESGYFLDENLQPDADISLANKPYLVVYHGTPFASTKSGVEGFVVLDRSLKELPEPFPFFTGRSTIRKIMAKFFNQKDEKEHYLALVEKMNQRMKEFYQEVKDTDY